MHVPAYGPMNDAESDMPDWQVHILKVLRQPQMLPSAMRQELHLAYVDAIEHLLTYNTLAPLLLNKVLTTVNKSHAQAVLALCNMIIGWSAPCFCA